MITYCATLSRFFIVSSVQEAHKASGDWRREIVEVETVIGVMLSGTSNVSSLLYTT